MKRGLTLLLASLMLAVGMTACGGDTKNPQSGQNNDTVLDSDNSGNRDNANDRDSNGTLTDGDRNGTDGMMQDVENGLDDMMRDTENAVDGLVDDLSGDHANNANAQLRGGPGWNGNLKRPDYPGTAGGGL